MRPIINLLQLRRRQLRIPAALRVKVVARIESNGCPAASPMKRLLNWNVLPVPADARITVSDIAWGSLMDCIL